MAKLTAAQIKDLDNMCVGASRGALGTKVAELEITIEDELPVVYKALAGDLVLVVDPVTTGSSEATITEDIAEDDKYVRAVGIELQSASGDVHEWYNGEFAIAVTEVTAGNGDSAIADSATEVTMVNGVGTVSIEYTGTWADGVKQVETATAAGTASESADEEVTVTSALFADPEVVVVTIADGDDASAIAGKIRAELADNAVVAEHFVVSGEAAAIILTAKVSAANDGTLNIAIAGNVAGVDAELTSANTTAGVAKDTQTLTVTGGTVLGYSVANKTSIDTIIA